MRKLVPFILLLFATDVYCQYIQVADTAFESALIKAGFDDKYDGRILESSCLLVDTLKVGGRRIKSLSGIQEFKNLKHLDCSDNQLKEIDLSGNELLTFLNCTSNSLRELNTQRNGKLSELRCSNNGLKKLDLPANKELLLLRCEYNALTKLDLSKNKSLVLLLCYNNRLSQMNILECKSLELLFCDNNNFTQLDISSNLYLVEFRCQKNPLEKIYISKLNIHDRFNDAALYLGSNEPLGYLLFRIIRK